MSNYNIHFSPTGGTKKVADLLSVALGGEWQQTDLCHDIAPTVLTAEDICLVSVPWAWHPSSADIRKTICFCNREE